MLAIPLPEYIQVNYKGVKAHFAKDYAIPRQNVNTLIRQGYVVIGDRLFRPMAHRGEI